MPINLVCDSKGKNVKSTEQIAGECTWCESPLGESVHGIGSSYSELITSSKTFIPVSLTRSDRSLLGAVLRNGSRAYNEGYRLIFGACSDACADGIEKALAAEGTRFLKRTKLAMTQ